MPTTTNVLNKTPVITGTANQISVVNAADNSTSTISLASAVVNSSQPLFTAYLNVNQSNATGDGTVAKIPYNVTTVNQGASFNTSTNTFTAPFTGNYLFCSCNIVLGAASGTTIATLVLVTTAASYTLAYYGTYPQLEYQPLNGQVIVPMTIGDTALVQITLTGSTKTAIIAGTVSQFDCFLSGTLLTA